jgi:succinate-semialdehyde dehydrogenase / glutarate-semialdehyde dehydrogenase
MQLTSAINSIILMNMSTVQISFNPYTLQENGSIPTMNSEQIEIAVSSVHKATKTWSKTSLDNRKIAMESFKQQLISKSAELAKLITLEIGCPMDQTLTEVNKCITVIDYYLTNVSKYLDPELVYEDDKVSKYIHYDAIGTLLHISPYNYPLYLALRPIIPALLAGNTVLLKTPSQTPLMAKLVEELIATSTLPKGVFEILFVSGSDIEPVIEDDRINLVTLIGSEKAGSQVALTAGKHLKKSLLELGGSDPMIVDKDANLDIVISSIMSSRIRNAGQSCNAIKRVIVHKSIENELVSRLKTELESLVAGDPTEANTKIGPMANSQGLHSALNQINESIKLGAKLITGGTENPKYGYFLTPTILTDVTPEMLVFQEEVFAPVVPIITFETIQEAIELANQSVYGLGACIFSGNKDNIKLCIAELETGNIAVNTIVRGDPLLPYGGIKRSGYGREFGKVGLHELCNIKSVVINKA